MIRRPPRSTLDRSSAASDVYKRQLWALAMARIGSLFSRRRWVTVELSGLALLAAVSLYIQSYVPPVSYTHLRAHATVLDIVCRLLLENKKSHNADIIPPLTTST